MAWFDVVGMLLRWGHLGLAAMADLYSSAESQTKEILHFPEVSEIICFEKHYWWTEQRRDSKILQPAKQFKVADRGVK